MDFAALLCEWSDHYMIDVPALDAAEVTAVVSRSCGAVVVAVPPHHLCDGAVVAPSAAPVNPQRVTGRAV